jgi:Viral BACON domain
MDTKRCLSCRKVLRADSQSCSRCGYVFSQAPVRRSGSAANGSRRSATASFPSNPPASQHRAGHYSGFHPEDQPFQSSFMPVQRPPAITRRLVEQDSDELLQPVTPASIAAPQLAPATELPVPEQLPRRSVASPAPSPLPMPQRYPGAQSPPASVPQLEFVAPPLPSEPAWHEDITAPLPRPPYLPRKRQPRSRIVPMLLFASLLFFVLATSILAFLLLERRPVVSTHPVLTADPGALRLHDSFLLSGSAFQANQSLSLTRDANILINDSAGKPYDVHTDDKGNFAVQITITDNWAIGTHSIYAADNVHTRVTTTITVQQAPPTPPKLQLPASLIDIGADVPGAISHKTINLTNGGGGQILWQAGSDSSWLTISPGGGNFSGSENAALTVNRANLAPQAYTGYITFYQNGKDTALTLKVTMAVSAFAANLSLTPASLTFSGTTAQNPANQSIAVQNTGGQALDWTVSIGTSTGGKWLNVSDASGHLEANSQQTITVSANSAGLAVGSYQGSLTFSYAGGTPAIQVLVTLVVSPPPSPTIVVKSNALSFSTIQGKNPAPQTFTIANTGNAPLNWAIAEDANAAAFAPASPNHGNLAPGTSTVITVNPNVAASTASVIAGHITISDTDKGTPVQSQQVTVTITISNQAVISVSDASLSFNHTSAITNSTQLLVITNSGSAPLNWTLSQPLPSWLSVDIPGGTLSPGTSTFVSVTCDSAGLPAGNIPYTLVVSDTDANTPVAPQHIAVTLAVT